MLSKETIKYTFIADKINTQTVYPRLEYQKDIPDGINGKIKSSYVIVDKEEQIQGLFYWKFKSNWL